MTNSKNAMVIRPAVNGLDQYMAKVKQMQSLLNEATGLLDEALGVYDEISGARFKVSYYIESPTLKV